MKPFGEEKGKSGAGPERCVTRRLLFVTREVGAEPSGQLLLLTLLIGSER